MKFAAMFLAVIMFFGCKNEGEKYWEERLEKETEKIESALSVVKSYPLQQFQSCLAVYNSLGEKGEHLLVGGQIDAYPVFFHLYIKKGRADGGKRLSIGDPKGLRENTDLSFSELGIIQESDLPNVPRTYSLRRLVNLYEGWVPDYTYYGRSKLYVFKSREISQLMDN